VVAATNVDLDEAVRAGSFRRDLLARLRASNRPLELPPLRARRDDLPAWADHFVREARPGGPAVSWTAGALECLLLFGWPENLRRGSDLGDAAGVEHRNAVRELCGDTEVVPSRRALRASAEPAAVATTPEPPGEPRDRRRPDAIIAA
jgi:transcriptional regulator with GAF, ATPase, and Fis domain